MINPNIFYTSYEDLQISEEVENMHYIVVNAGEAHATGIEIDWRAKLSGSVELYGSLGIIQTEYDEYEENQGYGDQDYSGNKMVNTPAYTFNLGAKYRNPNGFFASMNFQRFGETYFSSGNAQEFKRDSFHLINGKVGWEFAFGLEAYVYVTNALDEEYFTEASQEYGMYMVGQPRTFGMQLAYRF
jgi:iron complex outermembrane receptor protein